ncbi:GATA transcription factor 19 [Amaranthus tricolor]|uniref:GATA transcription factor 19 n=1 Tax=Amaranthus tricolor TaxID=29722 RepID=UPI0025863F1E|nr:GATA transcription factor 19 [Amaranthus tricolor]
MVGPFNEYPNYYYNDDENDYIYSSSSSSSYSSVVDCTLSLATPSTRLSGNNDHNSKPTPRRNSVSSFCWDLLNSNSTNKTIRTAANTHSSDPMFVRRCANCDTTSTPLWRNGPRGPKSLCNACGIRYKKEERRAAKAAAATTTNTSVANNGVTNNGMMDPQYGYYNGSYSWGNQYTQTTQQKTQFYGAPNEFRFIEDDHGSDPGVQFLSWLNHDRPTSLVHDFTR